MAQTSTRVQGPSPRDSIVISGRVLSPAGEPIAGATVTIAVSRTHTTLVTHTDSTGRFWMLLNGDSSDFIVTIDAQKMARVQLPVAAPEGRSVTLPDIRMTFAVTTLRPVNVRALRAKADQPGTASAGALESFVPSERADRFVADRSSLEALAALIPGATLSSGPGGLSDYSVAGAASSQNSVTLDGATSGVAVPRDAIAGAVVRTATSDVSQGRFSGGQIAAQTVSGSSSRRTAMRVVGTDPLLQMAGTTHAPVLPEYRDLQLSATNSGPAWRKGVYYFGAAQIGRRTGALASYLDADSGALATIGVTSDSIRRLVAGANQFGIPLGITRGDARVTNSASALLNLSARRPDQSAVDFRVNASIVSEEPIARPFSASPSSALNGRRAGGEMNVAWTRPLGSAALNSLRTNLSLVSRSATPLLPAVPAATVIVAGSGSIGGPALLLGGTGAGMTKDSRTAWESNNETVLQTSNTRHRLKFGEFLRVERLSRSTAGDAGTFGFTSLASFNAGAPELFSRTIGSTSPTATAYSGALYAGDRWRPAVGRLSVEYGLRLEGYAFGTRTFTAAQVASVFGLRTDRLPAEWHVSPRVGVTWQYGHGPGGRPRGEVRAGVGEYRGVIGTSVVNDVVAASDTGTHLDRLTCVGVAAPAPNWVAYSAGLATPTQCVEGTTSTLSLMSRDVAGFARDYQAPRSWRATTSVSGSVTEGVVFTLSALYSRGVAQAAVLDLNLRPTAGFRLASEGGRPIYAAPADIVTRGGLFAPAASRADARYGRVWEYRSDLSTDTKQVTALVNLLGGYSIPGSWQVAYTWSSIQDEARGYFGSTGGDPRMPQRGRSALERRHQVLVTTTFPANRWFTSYATGRFSSGIPYSPLVASDVNGDGLANDRAFVFAPTALDTGVGAGVRQLLGGNIPDAARRCLRSQIGSIAGRNSCTGPWSAALDLQATLRPERLGFSDRVAATFRVVNLFAALDQLLNGTGRLRGWGGAAAPDPVLLTPVAFDSSARRFVYNVNPRFGRTDAARGGLINPFQVILDVRIAVGPDPRRNELLSALGRGPSARGPAPTAADLKKRFAGQFPDPFQMVLAFKDSLGLTTEQLGQIVSMQAAYTQETDSLWIATFNALVPTTPDGASAPPLNVAVGVRRLNQTVMEVQRRQLRWGRTLRSVLSPTQRAAAPLYAQHVMFDDESTVEPLIR